MDKKSLERLKENLNYLKNNDVGNVKAKTFLKMIFYGVELNEGDVKGMTGAIVQQSKEINKGM